jgi:hypothetical protein
MRRQRRIARRVLDVAMPEIRLDRARVVAALASLWPPAWRSMALTPRSATTFDARLDRAIKMSKQGPLKLIENRAAEERDG